MNLPAPRIGIVGARRRRQGLGPFMARFLRARGANIAAVLGTSEESAGLAARELEEIGISARPCGSPEPFFGECELDAVVIASPHESHRACLEAALDHGQHVLCEKPFIWSQSGESTGSSVMAARDLVRRYTEAGLLLQENVQWAYTLNAYRALHSIPAAKIESLGFLLGPAATDDGRITDSLSHVLSLLQALDGRPDERPAGDLAELPPLENITFEETPVSGSEVGTLWIRFDYPGRRGVIPTEVELRHSPDPPRPAGYAIDGCWVHREIEPESYAMSFVAEESRRAPVPDPMDALLADFLGGVRRALAGEPLEPGPPPIAAPWIVPRLAHLQQLHSEFVSR
ncbi:MAG: Gfo/Idh/MocA family oxidoreductase [Planctomycetota bacterium]